MNEVTKKPEIAKPAPDVLQKYVVVNGPICIDGGGPEAHSFDGDVVMLTAKQAKHFNKIGRLKPYVDDNEDN